MPRLKTRAKKFTGKPISWTKSKGTPIANFSQIVTAMANKTAQELEAAWLAKNGAVK